MKRFICVFPKGDNIHLTKDVGLIPYFLNKEKYFESTIAFYKDKNELPFLNTEVQGLKYKKIKKIIKYDYLNIFFFMLGNLFRYDVVMLFHPNYYSLLIAYIIKRISFNRIKFYFKLDVDSTYDFSVLSQKSFKRSLFNFLMNDIALLSVESYDDFKKFKELNKFNVEYITNGLIPQQVHKFEKKNIMLTVGRLGTFQKDTETLLNAFKLANPANLKLVLVGTIEVAFNEFIVDYFEKYPWLKSKVEFVGPISDRDTIMDWYRQSKYFLLSSRNEGFPLALLEAVANGCYIISSDLPASRDVTGNQKYGKLFPIGDSNSLASIISHLNDDSEILPSPLEIVEYANQKYDWRAIVGKINSYLN